MYFLGRVHTWIGCSATGPATRRLDVRQSAINCYKILQGRTPPLAVPKFPAHKVMKGNNVNEYNDYIVKLSKKVNDAFWKKKGHENRYLWESSTAPGRRLMLPAPETMAHTSSLQNGHLKIWPALLYTHRTWAPIWLQLAPRPSGKQ